MLCGCLLGSLTYISDPNSSRVNGLAEDGGKEPFCHRICVVRYQNSGISDIIVQAVLGYSGGMNSGLSIAHLMLSAISVLVYNANGDGIAKTLECSDPRTRPKRAR